MAISQNKIDTLKASAPLEIEELTDKIKDFNNQIEVLEQKKIAAIKKRAELKANLEAINELEK